MHTYDVIVLGVGGMGGAACDHLARRGLDVLGIEQFHLGHDRGSSHGATRLIRKAYFEHPDYVPLLHDAYRLWRELEADARQRLFERVGLLLIGGAAGAVIGGVRTAGRIHALPFEELSAAEATRRFPGFHVPDEMVALFEHDAGLLHVERCVHAQIERALANAATLLTGQIVRDWSATRSEVRVRTEQGEFRARHLVITAGAWAARFLGELGAPLRVLRMVQLWFMSDNTAHQAKAGCPAFCCDAPDGFFYGFPGLGDGLLKVAEHTGGRAVDDPESLERDLQPDDLPRVLRFVSQHLPGVRPLVERHSVCMYTMTPDQHFILDRHPHHDHVFIAAGFSGHGFKFAPVVGAVLADLITSGRTAAPIGFLGARRATLRPS